MREPYERKRHFVVGEKRNFTVDEPAVYRKDTPPYEPSSDKKKSSPQSAYVRRTLREREMLEEEEVKAKFAVFKKKGKEMPIKQEDYDDFEDETERKRAPLVVRIFAWGAALVIFFVAGYFGTNYFFNMADKKAGVKIGNVVAATDEIKTAVQKTETPPENTSYNLYLPENGSFTKRGIEITKGTTEDDASKVLTMYVDSLKETKTLDNGTRLLNLFTSGEWLYLDMNTAFQNSLKTLGKENGELVIKGMLKTARENFSPIKKIKFYVDGRESKVKAPVDLSKSWETN